MEKTKPSKGKASKNQKSHATSVSNKRIDWRHVGKKTFGQGDKSHTEDETRPSQEKQDFSKRPLQQPKSRLDSLDAIWQETNVGQDFEILVNAPLSTGRFMFKSEKNWTLDASKYDEFFSVNVKKLAAIINCIPYNQLIELDNKYFTKDELTEINNTAEQAKKAYHTLHSSPILTEKDIESETCQALRSERLTDEKNSDSETMEDLDFLLSLKEPVRAQPIAVNVASSTKNVPDELEAKNIPAATKSIDLEKWLDLVLDD